MAERLEHERLKRGKLPGFDRSASLRAQRSNPSFRCRFKKAGLLRDAGKDAKRQDTMTLGKIE